jgi:hypothetical protein
LFLLLPGGIRDEYFMLMQEDSSPSPHAGKSSSNDKHILYNMYIGQRNILLKVEIGKYNDG